MLRVRCWVSGIWAVAASEMALVRVVVCWSRSLGVWNETVRSRVSERVFWKLFQSAFGKLNLGRCGLEVG